MVVFLYIAVLLQVFAHTVTGKSKSVNLALETVLEFDKHNLDSDVKIIDNVQRFLSKVRNVLDENRVDSGRRMGAPYLQFTDFLHTCIETLKTYNDKDLQEFAQSFNDEIRKYHYKGCKFYELLENNDARQYMSNKFDEFRKHSPKKLRKVLNKIQKRLQNTKSEKAKAIVNLINSLYRLDSQSKFKTFIDNLEAYKTKPKNDISIDLNKIIKNGIRALIFDHYSNLNPNVRQDVKVQVNAFINPGIKSIERNETVTKVPSKWDSHDKQPAIDNQMRSERVGLESNTDNDKREVETKKHKHSKQLNQEMEHDIEAEVTNKWLFEEVTTEKYKKKKRQRLGKHGHSKSDKKLKKHKKKKAQVPKIKEAITKKPLNLLFRMSPGVEEHHLPENKETTKSKTIMRVREDKPLNEIFSETAAEIFVGNENTLKNRVPPPIMTKDLSNKKDEIGRFRAAKSMEMSHSEQDKKDGLSIETWRREFSLRRSIAPNNDDVETKQAETQTKTTLVETNIDPFVLKKIHNLEEELLNVKKKMRQEKKMRKQKAQNPSTSGSSESDSDDSDDQKTTETTKSKPTKAAFSTSSSSAIFPSTSSSTLSTTLNEKKVTMIESSNESSSTETEEKQGSTNATTIASTNSKVDFKTLTAEKKPSTISLQTTTVAPHIKNTSLIDFDHDKSAGGKNEDSMMQLKFNQGIIPVRERARDHSSRESKKIKNATTTEISQSVVTTKNEIYELQFNINHDINLVTLTKVEKPTTPIPKPVDIILKSHGNDTSTKVKSSKYSKHITDIPDIVDVISVLNSTISTQDKLERLQSLRRNIDLMSDDDPNGIS